MIKLLQRLRPQTIYLLIGFVFKVVVFLRFGLDSAVVVFAANLAETPIGLASEKLLELQLSGDWLYGAALYYLTYIFVVGFGTLLDPSIGYLVLLLTADYLLLKLLIICRVGSMRGLLWYWLSPLVIVFAYAFGYNEFFALLFLIATYHLLRRKSFFLAGCALGFALSSKAIFLIFLPFYLLFLARRQHYGMIRELFVFLFGAGLTVSIIEFNLIAYGAIRENLVANRVSSLIWDFTISVSEHEIYVYPFLYTVLLVVFFQARTRTYNTLSGALLALCLVTIIAVPTAFNWFIWIIPLGLVYANEIETDKKFIALSVATTISWFLWGLILQLPIDSFVGIRVGSWLTNIVLTVCVCIVSVCLSFVIKRCFLNSRMENFFKNPKVISIAGDSGVGKDTLVESLRYSIGQKICVEVAGDDYHRWDRGRPMWSAITHLNPLANDLAKMSADIASLKSWKGIIGRRYDHDTGMLSKVQKKKARQFILVNGLHSYFSKELRDLSDIKVFIEMEPSLRRLLKIERDVNERGYSIAQVDASIESRKGDYSAFVEKQKSCADIVFGLEPSDNTNRRYHNGKIASRLSVMCPELVVINTNIERMLIGFCGLAIERKSVGDQEIARDLSIEGDIIGEDLRIVLQQLFPHARDYWDDGIEFDDGTSGLMVFFILVVLLSRLERVV